MLAEKVASDVLGRAPRGRAVRGRQWVRGGIAGGVSGIAATAGVLAVRGFRGGE